jgi:hypothetical protein
MKILGTLKPMGLDTCQASAHLSMRPTIFNSIEATKISGWLGGKTLAQTDVGLTLLGEVDEARN